MSRKWELSEVGVFTMGLGGKEQHSRNEWEEEKIRQGRRPERPSRAQTQFRNNGVPRTRADDEEYGERERIELEQKAKTIPCKHREVAIQDVRRGANGRWIRTKSTSCRKYQVIGLI